MSNTLEAFGASIDLDASKVLNFPSLIFLCGGPVGSGIGAKPSLRGRFYRRMEQEHPDLFERVLLAEVANKWSKTPRHYDHLFDLENDLAYLSAVILLFVESPGSIAELGAFCNVDALSRKLVAVLEHSHQDEESFIQDGPVALMKKNDARSVLFYPWLGPANEQGIRSFDEFQATETVTLLIDRVVEDMSKLAKEEKFDSKDCGHCLLLIADFVKLGSIVKIGEIESFLAGAGLNQEVPKAKLGRYLFLLERLKLISKTQYGNKTYYVGGSTPKEFIHYGVREKQRTTDRMRLQSDLLEVLRPLDPDRMRAREAFFRKMDAQP
jgi:hypothetical protein